MRKWLSLFCGCALLLAACTPVSKPGGAQSVAIDSPAPAAPLAGTTDSAPPAVPASLALFPPGTQQARVTHLPDAQPLSAFTFSYLDERQGWLAGGPRLLATDDGGRQWHAVATVADPIRAIAFATPDVGFLGTDQGLLATKDSGRTWQPVPAAGTGAVWRLEFPTPTLGWLVGAGGLRVSADGGQTWAVTSTPCATAPGLFSFRSRLHGWYLCVSNSTKQGESRRLYETTDGGDHWTPVVPGDQGPWSSPGHAAHLAFADDTQGWLDTSDGELLLTTDGGRTWHPADTRLRAESLGLQFLSPQIGYQLLNDGYGALAATRDGGATWTAVYPPLHPTSGGPRVFFAADHGIAGYTALDHSQIFATADGGRTWQPRGQIAGMSVLYLSFSDAAHGWAAGQLRAGPASWAAYATADGGATWSRLTHAPASPHAQEFAHISLVDPQTGFLTGDGGQLFVTHDGGASFAPVGQAKYGRGDLHFVTAKHGWEMVGWQLMETKDGGETWSLVPLPDWMRPESFQVLPDGRLVLAVMNAIDTQTGGVFFSSDAGRTWTGRETPGIAPDTVAFAPDGLHGWFGTGQGQFQTTDGGRSWAQRP